MTAQLPLPDPRTDILRRVQAALVARFGRVVRPADKRRSPEWTLVQGLVGAQTKTARSNASTDTLLATYGTWDAVADAEVEQLAALLHLQTFPDMSARRLKTCLLAIRARCVAVDLSQLAAMETAAAMDWLEALPGVARKISAQVVNTSTLDQPAMVIEGHHRRIMQRMGLVPPRADTTRCYDELMPVLPPEWSGADMDEHHLLLKQLGQSFCRPRQADCPACPLRTDCQVAPRGP